MIRRRTFLAAATVGALGGALAGVVDARADEAGDVKAIDFARSYLHCSPNNSGIWVRIQMECLCTLVDREAGTSDEFAMGVVAKTGLTKDKTTGGITPGYDYWLIFSKQTVYTRRTHASVYLRNPTTLTEAEFGSFGWKLNLSPAAKLADAGAIKTALESGKRLVARTELTSSDAKRVCIIDYPVKWADCGVEKPQFRVETGPIVLLDPDRALAANQPTLDDFRWAYVDFRDFANVRLLLDRPTGILSEARFFPPKEDKRESRPNPALTGEQVAEIERRVFAEPSPIPIDAMRQLFSTDHYSELAEKPATNSLFAID